MSDNKLTIFQHLHFIQKNLNVNKKRTNKFGNYNYRNCEDIVEAVKKIMPEGCFLTLDDSISLIGDRYYVCAKATFYFNKNSHSVTSYARESLDKKGMDSAQITGSASSYARKYALNGLFAIDDSKDIDSDEYQNNNDVNQHQSNYSYTVPDIKASTIESLLSDTYTNIDGFMKFYSVESLSNLNIDQLRDAFTRLNLKLNNMKKA